MTVDPSTISTRTAFPYWVGLSVLELTDSADEYEQAVAEGRFVDNPDAGADLLRAAADLRAEIARRLDEHWHPGSILHSHPGGQAPHQHEETANG